jgi:GNAT superfamily N-acetyltransferase
MTETHPFVSGSGEPLIIREVTPRSLDIDLAVGRLVLPAPIIEGLEAAIWSKDISFLVAETPDGDPRGQAGVNWKGPVKDGPLKDALEGAANVAFVEVHGEHEGAGIGQNLMLSVEELARRRKRGTLYLTVDHANERGRMFWDRQGYRTVEGLGSYMSSQFRRDDNGIFRMEPEQRTVAVMSKHLDLRV